MSDGPPFNFWVVACPLGSAETKEYLLSILSSRVGEGKNLCSPDFQPVNFYVPDGEQSLKFGSFDNLIELVDTLAKHDNTVEQVLRRMERQTLDLIPDVTFSVISQHRNLAWDQYLRTWKWDDAKFPKARPIQDNLKVILDAIGKLDEEMRNKTLALQDLKSQLQNISKREGYFTNGDLFDVLTPDVVNEGPGEDADFISTPHFTTIICVVPRRGESAFLTNYERCLDDLMGPGSLGGSATDPPLVVPMSARQLAKKATDRDGATIWRVVVQRTKMIRELTTEGGKQVVKWREGANIPEEFRKKMKDHCTVREFEYSRENFDRIIALRAEKLSTMENDEKFLKKICQATFSDTFVAWIHIKAMRAFVESVLRFGVPPRFAAFLMKPNPRQVPQLRSVLHDLFCKSSQFGSAYATTKAADAEGEGDEWYPYVSLSFSPLVMPRIKDGQ